jgi:hypothetical protein
MIVCRSQSPVFFAWFILPLALALVGCRPGSNSSSDDATATALYGAPTGTASVSIVRSAKPSAGTENWETNDFFVLSTELSPATLVHSKTPHLTVFGGMTNAGLGAPRYVAWPTREGPRTFNRGDKLDVSVMTEGWVLVWWSGAEGWTNWDCPWALFLQHKPDAMSLDDDGLHLDFPKQAGDVVMMPLYGYEKLALENFDFRATNRLAEPKVKVKTWEWPKVITRDPLTRIRYWIAATRDFPIHCEESFSVDREQGTVVVRSKIHRRTIVDDWKSRRVKLAPISPALALAAKDGAFPVRFSGRWFDLELPTPLGPFLGIEGGDEYDTTFATLRYVNEMETISETDPGTNTVATSARAALRQIAAVPDASLRTARGAFWYARALPHLYGTTRSNLIPALQTFLGERLAASGEIIEPNLIPAAWAYAHHSDDWELIRRHWAKLKQMFKYPESMTWAGIGSAGDGAVGEAAAVCLAFSRMAYKVGDMDGYHYGCFAFTRELTALAARQRSGEYARKHQPWHSLEVIAEDLTATGYQDNARGWQLSGPKPAGAGTPSAAQRWSGFIDFDVARFCRDYLKADFRKEFAGAASKPGPDSQSSMVQVRSLLFNEWPSGPDAATKLAAAGTGAGRIADCLAILRATQPVELRTLIPTGAASAFVTGLEREDSAGNPALLVAFSRSYSIHEEAKASWPELTWPNWSTPTGARWTFGQIRPVQDAKVSRTKHLPINWNSVLHGNAVP